MKEKKWTVQKFGGSSLANHECFLRVAEIIKKTSSENQAIVVSAVGGITDKLILLAQTALDQKDYSSVLSDVLNIHKTIIRKLELSESIINDIISDLDEIESLLKATKIQKESDNFELISSYGEIWSSKILVALLDKDKLGFNWLNARDFLTVEEKIESTFILDLSQDKINNKIKNIDNFVATGYICSTIDGVPTTLKRNGSDYSAALIAKLLKAEGLIIWTDVSGVLCADPRKVPEAQIVSDLSYDEAIELAYFGAKVIHPKAVSPLINDNIPLTIKNTFRPQDLGSTIRPKTKGKIIKGFSSISNVSLINVEGKGLIGVSGIASKIFTCLKNHGISVILISQGSSEYSICFAIKTEFASLAKKILEEEFFAEIQRKRINKIDRIDNCSVLAVVGDSMSSKPGVSGAVFKTLGESSVNIKAISQGSSERSISFVINSRDEIKALNALFHGMYLNKPEISVGIIGPGLIGKELISQFKNSKASLPMKMNVVATLSTSKLYLGENALTLEEFEEYNLDKFKEELSSNGAKVIIDCSSSLEISQHYQEFLDQGFHIITPNKKAGCFPMPEYRKLKKSKSFYLYETTVGAGLPILSTIKEMIATGDEVLEIEGILSGTLSYIFNNLKEGSKFSDIVSEAKDKGFTEPDPRDDLNGMDVARKILILARESGASMELSDITVKNLVPKNMQELPLDDFLNNLENLNPSVDKLQKGNPGKVLRYVAKYNSQEKKILVDLLALDKDHPFSSLKGAANIMKIKTKRYCENPLIIQGPGAGAEVTAAGVFGDLVKLMKKLRGSR